MLRRDRGSRRAALVRSVLHLASLGSDPIPDPGGDGSGGRRVAEGRRRQRRRRWREGGAASSSHAAAEVAASSLRIVLEMLTGPASDRDAVLGPARAALPEGLLCLASCGASRPGLLDLLCRAVASCSAGDDYGGGGGAMVLLRGLLFPPRGEADGAGDRAALPGDPSSSRRAGLALCLRLLRNPDLPATDRDAAWAWTVRTVLPTRRGGRQLPPAVGLGGVRVLMSGCEAPAQAQAPAAAVPGGAAPPPMPARPTSEVCSLLRTMTARTGLVQIERSLRRSPSVARNRRLAWRYETVPRHFADGGGGRARSATRRMAFSVGPYVEALLGLGGSGDSSRSPQALTRAMERFDVSVSVEWVSLLLENYLRLGRDASRGRWSPDGWLTAALVLHCPPPESCETPPKDENDADDISALLCYLYGCSLSIGIFGAVLRNTHSHYLASGGNSTGQLESNAKGDDVLRLMQYQLAVVYHLQSEVELALSRLDDYSSPVCSRNKPTSKKKRRLNAEKAEPKPRKKKTKRKGGDVLLGHYDSSRRARLADDSDDNGNAETENGVDSSDGEEEDERNSNAQEDDPTPLRRILEGTSQTLARNFKACTQGKMCDRDFLSPSLLLECLFSEKDKRIIDQFAYSLANDASDSFTMNGGLVQVIGLRKEILSHVHHLMVYDGHGIDFATAHILSLLESVKILSAALPVMRKHYDYCDGNDEGATLPSEPIILLAESTAEEASITVFQVISLLSSYYDVLISFIQSDQCVLTSEAVSGEGEAGQNGLMAQTMFEKIAVLLDSCDDSALACQILDFLSAIVVKSDVQQIEGRNVSWTVLHTIYVGNVDAFKSVDDTDHRPPALERVLQQVIRRRNRGGVPLALEALDRYALNSTKRFRENFAIKYWLLSYWGLATLSGNSLCDDLSKLVDSLDSFLGTISPSGEASIGSERLRKKTRDPKEEAEVPALTAKSYPVFFEVLLHMIIASFEMACPGEFGKVEPNKVAGSPYRDIRGLSRLFRYVAQLYATKFKLFPRQTLTVVVKACGIMVKASERQVLNCMEWRNAQPMLSNSDKKKGVVDAASSKFFQALIDSLAYNCTGSAIIFCDLVKSQGKRSQLESDEDSDYEDDGIDGEKWVYASSHKAVANLLLRSERVLESFRAVCATYNLAPPRIRISKSEREKALADSLTKSDSTAGALKPVNKLTAGIVRRKTNARQKRNRSEFSNDSASNGTNKSASDNGFPQVESAENNDVEVGSEFEKKEEDGFDAEESSRTSDSFGADGGWGDDMDDLDDDTEPLAIKIVT